MSFVWQDRLTLAAPAKINLFLRVTGRRPDGYHLINSWMQKVGLYDTLDLEPGEHGIRLRCQGGGVPGDQNNLVYKAAELFFRATRGRERRPVAGVDIELTKRIPVAAGLGGGSSDAAAALRGLNELYGCGCSAGELAGMGVQLGADVPFFLADAPAALATGIGEVLHPCAPLRHQCILLVNPGFPVSTAWVYQTFALTGGRDASKIDDFQIGVDIASAPSCPVQPLPPSSALVNDLESVTIASYPEIGQLKEELLLNGATGALMSGSGSTVFGLFSERSLAEACCDLLRSRFPHTYLVAPIGEE